MKKSFHLPISLLFLLFFPYLALIYLTSQTVFLYLAYPLTLVHLRGLKLLSLLLIVILYLPLLLQHLEDLLETIKYQPIWMTIFSTHFFSLMYLLTIFFLILLLPQFVLLIYLLLAIVDSVLFHAFNIIQIVVRQNIILVGNKLSPKNSFQFMPSNCNIH